MAIALKLDPTTGDLAQLLAADALQAIALEPRVTTADLVIGSTLTGAAKVVIGAAAQETQVLGFLDLESYSELNGIAAPGAPGADEGRFYKLTGDDGLWWHPNGGAAVDLTATGANDTLQSAYDLGNAIAVTDAEGSVALSTAAGVTVAALDIAMNATAAGGRGMQLTMDAAAGGHGINIAVDSTVGTAEGLRVDLASAAVGDGIQVTSPNLASGATLLRLTADLGGTDVEALAVDASGGIAMTAHNGNDMTLTTTGDGAMTIAQAGTGPMVQAVLGGTFRQFGQDSAIAQTYEFATHLFGASAGSNAQGTYPTLNYNETSGTKAGGIVVGVDFAGVSDTVNGSYTASPPVVQTTGSATFSSGDLVMFSGGVNERNPGLYEVATHVGTVLTLRGVSGTANNEDFTRDNFLPYAGGDAALIQLVVVSVLRARTDGDWEIGSGSDADAFTFSLLATGGSVTLQGAYDGGQTIDLLAATGDMVIDATDAVAFQIQKGAVNVLEMDTGGALNFSPPSGESVDFTLGGVGSFDVQTDGGGGINLRVDGTGNARMLTGDSGNVILDAQGTGDVQLMIGSTPVVTVNANTSVEIDPASGFGVTMGIFGAGEFMVEGSGSGDLILRQQGTGDVIIEAQGGEVKLSFAGQITRVLGDLVVDGTTTTVDSETVLIADNHLYLNAGYTTASAQTGGLVVNYLPTATTTDVNAAYVAGDLGVSDPTVGTVGAATFALHDFIQFSDSSDNKNEGLYEVFAHAANVLTIRGVGLNATIEDFTQNDFEAVASNGATITKVTVSVMRAGVDGIWEVASGSDTGAGGISFADLGTTAGSTLQAAYDAGQTVDMLAATGNVVWDATDAVSWEIQKGTNQVLKMTTDGAVEITPTGGQNLIANTTGAGVIAINATGASASLQLFASGATGQVIIGQGGGSQIVLNTAGEVDIAPSAGEDLTVTIDGTGTAAMEIDLTNAATFAIRDDGGGTALMAIDGAGEITFTPTSAQDFRVNMLGTGAFEVERGGVNVIAVTSTGVVRIDPSNNQNLLLTAAGTGSIILDASGGDIVSLRRGGTELLGLAATGAVNITPLNNQDAHLTATGTGDLNFIGHGSTGLTFNDSTEINLDQTGAGEVLNGVTSVVGAINALARAIDIDGTAGIKDYVVENGVTITAGDVVSQGTVSGRVTQGDANDVLTTGEGRFVGIALETGTGDVGGTILVRVALPGNFISDSGAAFTAGDALFMPDGTGRVTSTAPTGTGDLVKRIGWAHTATEYVVDPAQGIIL